MKLIKYLSCLPMLLFAVGCSNETEDTRAVETNEAVKYVTLTDSAMKQIQLETVHMADYANPLTVVGEVSFDEDHVVRVFPIVSGSVEKVFVSLGDYVKKGQLLATVLSTDISEYQLDFNVAKANYEVAKRNLERVKTLFEGGFASEKELNIAENELKVAQSDYTSKKQILELYGGSTQSNDAVFNMYAPNDGYIVDRNLNEGMQIRPDNNSSVFTISDLRSVWIWANVYESDISKIRVGDMVSASTISYPDSNFSGSIEKINNVLDPESRVIKVRTEISNPGELLKPEMFATVKIYPHQKMNALAVPAKAVFLENNFYYVIVKKGNQFSKRQVQTGLLFDNRTEIKAGLNSGEEIVTEGALFIANEINLK